jgi:hypothetical protein
MTKPIKLEDAYRFPGYVPQANVRGIFGDSSARVLTLRRKEKNGMRHLWTYPQGILRPEN